MKNIFKMLSILSLLVLSACGDARTPATPEDKLIHLTDGPIYRNEDGIYKGIPFAQPPVGELRWKNAREPFSWKEPRRFDTFGSACPQPEDDGKMVGSEDCLFLNVYTKAKHPAAKLPVMVYIHGGAFLFGSGSLELYNGEKLSEKGVVVVTINYRLGALGFMAHPELSAESPDGTSGNYALSDQIAALRWVKRNIARLGGDPDNVTVFGQSAGAESICLLLASPKAAGLFHAAIMQSPAMMGSLRYLKADTARAVSAEKVGERVGRELVGDGNPDVLKSLRAQSPEALSGAGVKIALEVGVELCNLVFTPIIDGKIITDHPFRIFQSGKQNRMPIMLGTTANEGSLFVQVVKPEVKTADDYRNYLKKRFGEGAAQVETLLPAKTPQEVWRNMDRVVSARWFGAWVDHLARLSAKSGVPAWYYGLSRKLPEGAMDILVEESGSVGLTPEMVGIPHSADIFYVFGFTSAFLDFDGSDDEFSEKIMSYWTNFAKKHNPNGENLPNWPKLTADKPPLMLNLGSEFSTYLNPQGKLYALIERTWPEDVNIIKK